MIVHHELLVCSTVVVTDIHNHCATGSTGAVVQIQIGKLQKPEHKIFCNHQLSSKKPLTEEQRGELKWVGDYNCQNRKDSIPREQPQNTSTREHTTA